MRVGELADIHHLLQWLEMIVEHPEHSKLAPVARIHAKVLRRYLLEQLQRSNDEKEQHGRQGQLPSRVEHQTPSAA